MKRPVVLGHYPEGMIEAQEKREPMLLRAAPEQWGITEDWIDEALDKAKESM